MKLAHLVYEIVKDAIEIPNSHISFDSFISGAHDSDRDFGSQISYAFKYANTAFARLRSLNKTILKIESAIPDAAGYVPFDKGEITAVVDSVGADYKRIPFFPFAYGIALKYGNAVFIEYRPFIPHFSLEDIRLASTNEIGDSIYVEREIDLSQCGLTDEMCEYVKEYAVGGLMQYLSPDISARNMQMAEAHFSALKTRYTNYPQREIVDTTKGGGAW